MRDDRRELENLTRCLWQQRDVVTYLLYKLTVTNLLLAADERRFVPDALREVELAVQALRAGELARDTAVRELAGRWSTDPEVLTLDEVARRSPPPYDHIFTDHRSAFRELAGEVERTARENRGLALDDLELVTDQLDQLTGGGTTTPTTYDAHGHLDASGGVGGRLREVL